MAEPEQPCATAKTTTREITIETLVHATKLTVGKHEQLEQYLKRLTHLTLNGVGAKRFQRIQNLHHCPNLKVLYLYDNAITKVEGLDCVPLLTHLHLQNNQIEVMEGMEQLVHLEKLYLEGNRIATLEGLDHCNGLQELHMPNQALPPSTLFTFSEESVRAISRTLRVLNLSNCNIAVPLGLCGLRALEILDLSRNKISELDEVFAVLSSLSNLVDLDLRQNPVNSAPKYREKVMTFSSSRLALLDKKDIDANQRRMMQSHLAHKFKKRQEAREPTTPSNNQIGNGLGLQLGLGPNDSSRKLEHGSTIRQLRSSPSGSGNQPTQKAPLIKDGLRIAGASCYGTGSAIGGNNALVRSSNNNNHN
ncbi:TPA: hypothetical protein N0F65_004399 [Lagenidium giganteum]|uniref:Uncharacterized protein n=1 Tax=Lagenidium giganteum TaxID=4803 RepID=A0AAV2ZDG3_9STRA|nr:TPA: hypothetical protein N0F65_004399 [Lagenidium giganteum]